MHMGDVLPRDTTRLKVIQKNPSSYRTAIRKLLAKRFPHATIALHYKNPLELLVATILSAQCTDKRVNMVTPSLFKKYKTAKDYANANPTMFEQEIRSTGFYRNKTKSVIGAARMIVKDFGGNVPDTMEGLLQLPGVARKTANVVLGNAFGKHEGIVVDTHVKRVAYRLGLTDNTDPTKIEVDLMKVVPHKQWNTIANLLIHHGREICKAPKPDCENCPLNKTCPSSLTRTFKSI